MEKEFKELMKEAVREVLKEEGLIEGRKPTKIVEDGPDYEKLVKELGEELDSWNLDWNIEEDEPGLNKPLRDFDC